MRTWDISFIWNTADLEPSIRSWVHVQVQCTLMMDVYNYKYKCTANSRVRVHSYNYGYIKHICKWLINRPVVNIPKVKGIRNGSWSTFYKENCKHQHWYPLWSALISVASYDLRLLAYFCHMMKLTFMSSLNVHGIRLHHLGWITISAMLSKKPFNWRWWGMITEMVRGELRPWARSRNLGNGYIFIDEFS